MDRLTPKIQKVIEALPLDDRTTTIITIQHDDTCGHWLAKPCDCDPNVLVRGALPRNPEHGGMTPEEDALLQLLGDAFTAFVKLPVLHPSDRPEFCHHIHTLQNMVAARPTFRALRSLPQPRGR